MYTRSAWRWLRNAATGTGIWKIYNVRERRRPATGRHPSAEGDVDKWPFAPKSPADVRWARAHTEMDLTGRIGLYSGPQRRRLRRQRRRRYGVDLLYEAMARCGYCSADVAATNVELKSRTSISYFFRARYSTGSNYRKCCIFSANAVKTLQILWTPSPKRQKEMCKFYFISVFISLQIKRLCNTLQWLNASQTYRKALELQYSEAYSFKKD